MTTQDRRHPGYIHGVHKSKLEWFVRAACRAEDVENAIFYPEDCPNRDQAIEQAKNVCAPCPVRSECHRYGNKVSLGWGIYGGLTSAERRRRIERARQSAGAA